MGATVEVHGVTAVFENGQWRSDDRALAGYLNMTRPVQAGHDPHYSRTVAEAAVDAVPGLTIIHIDEPTQFPQGTIF